MEALGVKRPGWPGTQGFQIDENGKDVTWKVKSGTVTNDSKSFLQVSGVIIAL